MYSIVGFSSGIRREAVICSMSAECMRLAVVGFRDAVELRQIQGRWIADNGEEVVIESLLPVADQTAIGNSSKFLVTRERNQRRNDSVAACISSSCSPRQTLHSRVRGQVLEIALGASAESAVDSMIESF